MPKDPDSLVDFTTANSDLEAEEIAGELAAQGIEAKVFSVSTPTMRFYTSEAIRIMVRREDVERATAALRMFRRQPRFSDWSSVETGDTSTPTESEIAISSLVCPSCRYELSGLDLTKAQRCPECGTEFADRAPVEKGRRMSRRTLVGLCALGVLAVMYLVI